MIDAKALSERMGIGLEEARKIRNGSSPLEFHTRGFGVQADAAMLMNALSVLPGREATIQMFDRATARELGVALGPSYRSRVSINYPDSVPS